MTVRLDHVVLWVSDPIRSTRFYQDVLGLQPLRLEEFRAGAVPFPSVRVTDESIIDLMPRTMAESVSSAPGMEGSAGHPVNHLCLSFSRDGFEELRARLEEHGIAVPVTMKDSFGAQGHAPETFYFTDPDGNILEARYYD
ncbi:VOC family protein [Actinocorallia sp. B10E7]|uniref:VOC family protein n=1 Tax=Actinocorallia sp. B10E7 TaxID=3153558 RepID=UPI00325F6008